MPPFCTKTGALDYKFSKDQYGFMLRRMVIGVTLATALYLLSYAILSTFGSYHRYVESFVGPTVKEQWLPRGFTHPFVVNFFWPVYFVDCSVWHPVRTETGWHYIRDKSGQPAIERDPTPAANIPR